MRVIPILVFLLSWVSGFSQNYFRVSGLIKHPTQDFVTLTLYKDWISEPEVYQLKLNQYNFWLLEIKLEEMAYCDLNFGENSLNLLKIEPHDNIRLELNNEDFYPSLLVRGEGSAKWIYQFEALKKFVLQDDFEVELSEFVQKPVAEFHQHAERILNEQLTLLDESRMEVSDNFYQLEKADIYGKIKIHELGNLFQNQVSADSLFIPDFPQEVISKSLYLSQLYEALITEKLGNYNLSRTKGIEIGFIQGFKGKIGENLVEKIEAAKLIEYLGLEDNDSETDFLVDEFLKNAGNKILKSKVRRQKNKLTSLITGQPAPNFILKNKGGKLVELKDFRGKNVVLGLYQNDCQICINNIHDLEYVRNFFVRKGKKDLEFVFINLSSPQNFKTFLKENRLIGTHLMGFEDSFVQNNFETEILPEFLLIDKSGIIVLDNLGNPSSDGGRSVISLLDANLYSKK